MHCVSKGLTPTQQRYSTIELECLAIVWAISKCSFYLHGLPKFTVYTDHRPLEGVFQKDLFSLASPRLQCMREKVAKYSFDVNWVPGKTHYIAGALSRAPLFAPQEQLDLKIDTAITCLAATSHPSMAIISRAVDKDYRALVEDVLHGTSTSSYSRCLKSDMASLSVSDGLVLLDSCRIILPIAAVEPVLQLLHASHSGINKTILLTRGLYYWPGMINDIKQLVSSCQECSRLLQSPQTPLPATSGTPCNMWVWISSVSAANPFSFVLTTGADTRYTMLSAPSQQIRSSMFSQRGSTLSDGPRPSVATGALNFAVTSQSFAPRTIFPTNYRPPTTARATVSPRLQ